MCMKRSSIGKIAQPNQSLRMLSENLYMLKGTYELPNESPYKAPIISIFKKWLKRFGKKFLHLPTQYSLQ